MALRIIRKVPDDILNKKTREVKKIDDRTKEILKDMVTTMNEAEGVGLAAPQVGILKKMFVANVGDGNIYKIINPEFLETKGKDLDIEGCLSIPGFQGVVERAKWVKMKYTDENGEEKIIETDGLLAKCLQHEYDHLEGILITSKHIEEVTDENYEEIMEMITKFKEENKDY